MPDHWKATSELRIAVRGVQQNAKDTGAETSLEQLFRHELSGQEDWRELPVVYIGETTSPRSPRTIDDLRGRRRRGRGNARAEVERA